MLVVSCDLASLLSAWMTRMPDGQMSMSEWDRVENDWGKNRTDWNWMKHAWWKCSLFMWSVDSSSLIEAGLCVSWWQTWSHTHTHTLWDNDRLHRVTEHTVWQEQLSCEWDGATCVLTFDQLRPVIIRACPSVMAINGFYRAVRYLYTYTLVQYPLVLFKEAQLWFSSNSFPVVV